MSVHRVRDLSVVAKPARPERTGRKPLLQGFSMQRAGLEIEDWVDQRTWYEFGKFLQQTDYAWAWMVADWLAFGNHKYGDQVYQSAARLFGKAPRTWEDYAYIARNVKISERSETLPILSHKPVARFVDNPGLQRKLLAIAEQNGLSKATFETVIDLYLQDKSYAHLLPAEVSEVGRARLRAEKERERIRRRAEAGNGREWLEYACEQADAWNRLVKELSARSSQ
jgi:hypothetical protein